jgi:ribonucleotide reductase alpha subunit
MNAVINNEMWDLCFPDTQWFKYKELWNGDLDEWIRLEYPVTVT